MTGRFKSLILFTCILALFAICITPVLAENETEKNAVSFMVLKGTESKTIYTEGEQFDSSGFIGKITYADGESGWIFNGIDYLETYPLSVTNTYITFVYDAFIYKYPILVTPKTVVPPADETTTEEPPVIDPPADETTSEEPPVIDPPTDETTSEEPPVIVPPEDETTSEEPPIIEPPVKTLIGIEFSSSKVDFLAFETVDPSIFSAAALFSDGTVEPLDLSLCSIYPSITDPITSATKMYTLTYSNGETNYSDVLYVNVTPAISIELSGIENVKLYECMPFNAPESLVVTAYYDDAKTISRVIDGYTVSYNSILVSANEQNKTKFTVTADNLTAEAELEVLPIVNYKIATPKSAFYYGDIFPKYNFKVTAFYSDGTYFDVSSQVIWDAPEVIAAGSKVSAVHNNFDLKDFLPFTLPQGTLDIITEPTKTHYEIGEIFDTTGLSVGINYSNGERRLLNPTDYEIIATSPLTAADKNVIVSYYGATTNISISVGDEAYIVSIQLIGVPDVMSYYEGGILNTSGINIEAYMSDGTTVIVNPKTLTFTPALGTPLTTDITQVIISTNDGTDKYCECSFPITVMEKFPTGLMATSKPHKLEYAEGEIFNPDGLTLSLFFNDGSSIVPSSFTFDPELGSTIILHSNATEKCIINVICEYEGQEYKYPLEITVTPAEIENLIITRQPIKTVYEIGEEFIPMGVELMLIYKDRTLMSQVIPEGYYTYSPTVITKDTKEVVFSFRGLTVSLPITVNGGASSEETTEPIDPPTTTNPPDSSEVTANPPEITTEDTTTEHEETTVEDPITTEPEDPTDPVETTLSPESDITTEGESTTDDSSGGGKSGSSLLYLWIIIIVIIVAALIVLIIYYKKNFT